MPNAETTQGITHCRNCQHPLRADARFCSSCGHSVVGEVPSSRQARSTSPSFATNWTEIIRVAWLYGSLLSISLAFGLTARGNPSPWPDAFASTLAALVVIAAASRRYREILPLFNVPRLSMRLVIELAVVAIAFIVFMNVYFYLLERMGVPVLRMSTSFQKSGWSVGSMFLLVSISPAIIEELAFRGVIQSTLEHVFTEHEAWLIQAALFSVLHLLPVIFASHFLMGLCFGYMRLRTRSLYPSMLFHGSWNALVLCEEIYWS